MKVRMLTALSGVIASIGCASAPPPAKLTPSGIDASFGKTWNAVVDVLAEQNIPVKTMDRASGFVAAEVSSVDANSMGKLADCGGFLMQILTSSSGAGVARYNILVRGDSTKSTVKVTARFVSSGDTPKDCPSKNVFEGQFQSDVKARAEGRTQ